MPGTCRGLYTPDPHGQGPCNRTRRGRGLVLGNPTAEGGGQDQTPRLEPPEPEFALTLGTLTLWSGLLDGPMAALVSPGTHSPLPLVPPAPSVHTRAQARLSKRSWAFLSPAPLASASDHPLTPAHRALPYPSSFAYASPSPHAWTALPPALPGSLILRLQSKHRLPREAFPDFLVCRRSLPRDSPKPCSTCG